MNTATSLTEIAVPIPIETARRRHPMATPEPVPARRAAIDWPFVAMIVSLCLFAAVFASTILRTTLHTVTSSSARNWTQGP